MKVLGAIIALVVMAQPALAATSLCVETSKTGFDWSQGAWTQSNFLTSQIIVRKVEMTDPAAEFCRSVFESDKLQEGIVRSEYSASRNACYLHYDVGTEPSYTSGQVCVEILGEADSVVFVTCSRSRFISFDFEPSGEYLSTRTYAAPDSSRTATDERDSLAMAIGKCSIIAP